MNVCTGIPPVKECCGGKKIVTLGTFDGVHIGHKRILEKVTKKAESSGGQSAVVTFDRHPAAVLDPKNAPCLLTSTDEKLEIFRTIGIDNVFILSFSKDIAALDPERFISTYLADCLGMNHFIVGYDHGFGKDRKGSTDILERLAAKYGFTLEVQKPVSIHGVVVNSSMIRKYIHDGKVNLAGEMLGRDYSFAGTVIPDRGIGTQIGIPTANIDPLIPEKIIPLPGVYAGWIFVEDYKRDAVISVGPRLTFGETNNVIEVHIPGFRYNIYGKTVKVGFTRRLRDIRKFDSTDELVERIKKDIEEMNQLITL